MISKLPRWVWIGTWVLAFIAGIINIVGLLSFEHQTVTHLTGNTSRLGEALANLDMAAMMHFGLLIGAFVLGTAISGFILQDSTLKLGRHYSLVLLLESLLLFVSIPLFKNKNVYGMYTAACASGLQNAMVSAYSGAVVRTTHLSGMFTDLGIYLGHVARGLPIDRKRMWLCFIVISGFLCGGIVGTLTFHAYGYFALMIPATLTAGTAIAYEMYQMRRLPDDALPLNLR